MHAYLELVSIIITTYNYASFLQQAVVHIFDNDYPSACIEVIIVAVSYTHLDVYKRKVMQGEIVTLPAGDKPPFDQHAIISIQKP